MSPIKLCCMVDPMPIDEGFIKLFNMDKLGRPMICRSCHDALIDGIPEGVRNAAASRGVWEAIVDYVHLKFTQEYLDVS